MNKDCLFRKIADYNKFELFPKDITKVKLSTELLDQIFAEFLFKNLSKASSSKKILKEIYNTFFCFSIVQSEFNRETKNTKYGIHFYIEEFEQLYTTNLCTEAGTWIKVPILENDEFEPDPEMI
jgi:hypothetical protein